mgnify:CR=1 FL=1
MSIAVSRRAQRVKPSPTLAVTALANKLKAEGKDVIGLGAGEPDFDTPAHIGEAAIAAIRSGFTRYTNVDGIVELKDAIIAKFKRDNNIAYERNQVMASTGGKQVIYNLCMALLDPGDEVIIPAPYWVSYPDMVMLADGLPVTPDAGPEQGYKITPKQLAASITAKTRLLLINSPSNPTGAAYTAAEWKALGEVLLDHPRIVIGTDDMYEKIYWGAEPFCSLLTAVPELYDRTVTINGVSKAYAMTGWRLGYVAGPRPFIAQVEKVHSHSATCATSFVQEAGVVALTGPQEFIGEMVVAWDRRRRAVASGLNNVKGITCPLVEGAFYAFPDIRATGMSSTEAADLLLREAHVALTPGVAFGEAGEGHLRLSFATSDEELAKAVERITNVLGAKSA